MRRHIEAMSVKFRLPVLLRPALVAAVPGLQELVHCIITAKLPAPAAPESHSPVRLTVFGEIVLRHGRSVLAGFAELQREIALTRDVDVGELAVAIGPYPADISGCEAAALLSQRHPAVSLDLTLTDWIRAKDAVLAGAADLAFADIREAREDPDFVTEPIRSGALSFFCAAAHPLAGRAQVAFGDPMDYPWAGPSFAAPVGDGMPKGERPCGTFDKATGRFRPRILVESFASAKRIALAGSALSAGFPFQIGAELAAGDLLLLPIERPFVALEYGFIAKRGRALSPAANAFMDVAREVESGMPQ